MTHQTVGETYHPDHKDVVEVAPGVFEPARRPKIPRLAQIALSRACRREGGHWWHPADAMIGWFCCQCGAERDGMPKDGT